MLRQAVVIAKKELLDHSRETRSLLAAAMHLLMGPAVVLLVSFSASARGDAKGAVLPCMMSIFALVAAFVGGMNIAMDVLAGERERRSLLPLLLNPVSRRTVILGKWLAISCYSVGGLAVTLLAFWAVSESATISNPLFHGSGLLCWAALGLLPLALLAAALQTAVSTICRTAKEAQTYLSLLIFIPMGIAMFLLFFPGSMGTWTAYVPIAGQQAIALAGMNSGGWSAARALTLALVTVWMAIGTVVASGKMLERDEIVYGG